MKLNKSNNRILEKLSITEGFEKESSIKYSLFFLHLLSIPIKNQTDKSRIMLWHELLSLTTA